MMEAPLCVCMRQGNKKDDFFEALRKLHEEKIIDTRSFTGQ